jgi:hypothetical protein
MRAYTKALPCHHTRYVAVNTWVVDDEYAPPMRASHLCASGTHDVCFDACFRFSFGSGAHDHGLSSEIVEQLVEEPWNYIAPLSSVPSADRRRSSHSRAWLRSPFLRQQSHLSGSSSLSVGLLVRKMFFRHAGKMRCGRCMHRCACVCAIRLQCVPSRDFILRNDA